MVPPFTEHSCGKYNHWLLVSSLGAEDGVQRDTLNLHVRSPLFRIERSFCGPFSETAKTTLDKCSDDGASVSFFFFLGPSTSLGDEQHLHAS